MGKFFEQAYRLSPTSTAVGERLLAGCLIILYDLKDDRPKIPYAQYSGVPSILNRELDDLLGAIEERVVFDGSWYDSLKNKIQVEGRVDIGGEYSLDGNSKIDCVVFGEKAFPIEVKMGMAGQGQRWSAFYADNFSIGKCVRKQSRYSEKWKGLAGRMPSVLSGVIQPDLSEYKSIADALAATEISIKDEDGNAIVSKLACGAWGLCVNNSNFMRSLPSPLPANQPIGNHDLLIFEFSDILRAIKDKNLEKQFDQMVSEIWEPFDFKSLTTDLGI